MANKVKWHICQPYGGKIEIVNSQTGKVICTISVEDHKSIRKAKKTAQRIVKSNKAFGLMFP